MPLALSAVLLVSRALQTQSTPHAINAINAIDATDAIEAMNATVARKIWDLLTSADRRSTVVLLGLMCIGMVQTQSTQ
jgi:hypothetical protein